MSKTVVDAVVRYSNLLFRIKMSITLAIKRMVTLMIIPEGHQTSEIFWGLAEIFTETALQFHFSPCPILLHSKVFLSHSCKNFLYANLRTSEPVDRCQQPMVYSSNNLYTVSLNTPRINERAEQLQ